MKPLAALFTRLAKRPKNTYIFTGACPQNRGIRKKRIPKAGPVVHSCHEPAKTYKGVPGESMQRFVRPVLFCLLVLAIFMCAFYTQRGTSFVNPFMLGRYADFAANSPLLSTVLLVVSLPAGILVFLLPESQAITLAVSDLGFALGLIVSVFALAAASGTLWPWWALSLVCAACAPRPFAWQQCPSSLPGLPWLALPRSRRAFSPSHC